MKKNILVISNDFPYPPNHGGRVDIFERIRAMNNLGHKVYLISTVRSYPNKSEIIFMDNYVYRSFFLSRKTGILPIFSLLPYQVSSRNNIYSLNNIISEVSDISFDICIIEGHYCLSIFYKLKNRLVINKSYLRVHNDEATYFSQLSKSEKNLLKKVFYKIESIKFYLYEKKIFSKKEIDALLHISSDELTKYEKKYKINLFLPASINIDDIVLYSIKEKKKVLFVGSLFMPNNIEGLFWYLDEVHSNVLNKFPDYKFIIAGNTKDINVMSLKKKLNEYTSIDFHESPSDLELSKLYYDCSLFINPMLSGAGVKLKTINAIKNGLPVVSTSTGNEGTGLLSSESILISDDPYSFSNNILNLLTNEHERALLTNNAQKFILDKYDLNKNLKKIL